MREKKWRRRSGITTLWLALVASAPHLEAQQRPPALDRALWSTDFTHFQVHPDSFSIFGPKDAVPVLNEPAFVSARDAAAWLEDREPVAVLKVGDDVRAYPIKIIMAHNAVNDVVGGQPVVVTFCVFCGSAVAYDRRFDGQVLDFGVAGALYNQNLVIYDRQTETWWAQIVGEGLMGRYAGEHLSQLPAPMMSFADFRAGHPDGRVLSIETGFDRPYGRTSMGRYEEQGPIARFFHRESDRRLPAKERVVVVQRGEDIAAVPFSALAERKVINLEVGGEAFVVLWGPGTASIYAQVTAEGKDVGAAIAYRPVVDGQTLHLRGSDQPGRFEDRETGSTWTLDGRAVAGSLSGKRLEPDPTSAVHFWFIWAAYRPDTRVVSR